MAKKRNLPPESSQLGEPPLKQHQYDQAFERSSTSPFGRTNSVFGQNNSSNNPFSPKPFGSTTPFGSQTDSSISGGGTSTGVFGAANTPFLLEFIGALPDYKYQSYEVRKQLLESIRVQMVSKQQLEAVVGDTSTPAIANTPFLLEFIGAFPDYKYQSYEVRKQLLESIRVQMVLKQQLEAVGDTSTLAIGFSHKPAVGGFGPFGRAIPTSVRKPLEAVGDADIQAFGSIGAPAFGATSTLAFGATSTPAIGFGQKPAFGGSGPFGRAIPTSRKLLEAVGAVGSTIPTVTLKRFADIRAFVSTGAPAFGATSTPAFGATSTPSFGATRIYAGVRSIPVSVSSRPYQTAKLESISAMPPYNYERFESRFAIAGADYCLIAVDFTRDDTKISQLFGNSVMAGCCGFQADVKALQEVLSALNLKYEGQHKMPMSCPEMHRLFCHFEKSHPILQSLVLGGLDSEGKGCLFQHYGLGALAPQVGYSSQNSGSRLIVPPILGYKLPDLDVLAQLSEADAVHLARTVFESTIPHTGDKLEIVVLNAWGINRQRVDLRKDSD